MKEHPILFNREMILALHAGRKTQTRRIMNPQPVVSDTGWHSLPHYSVSSESGFRHGAPFFGRCPYGAASDRLWVREAWRVTAKHDAIAPRDLPFERGMTIMYDAGGSRAHDETGQYVNAPDYPPTRPTWAGKGRPSIHMPRVASRTTIEVMSVRVERLQNITEEDAKAEGVGRLNASPIIYWRNYQTHTLGPNCDDYTCLSARESYQTLWDSINEARGFGWDTNPWVWVVEFSRAL
ncbi:MAG TPA: hypothetical protein VF534_13840 [Paraburkholderia sp.]